MSEFPGTVPGCRLCRYANHGTTDQYGKIENYLHMYCTSCGQDTDKHHWAEHPHVAFPHSEKPCPGWTEVLDESFEA